MIWITLAVLSLQVAVLVCQHRRLEYWKRQAMSNARARLTKDAACDAEKQEINRKAGRAIAQLNAQVEDLTSELQRVRNINRSLLRQLDRREGPADNVRPVRPCDGCPFCVCEKHGVICPSDPDFRCDTMGGADG